MHPKEWTTWQSSVRIWKGFAMPMSADASHLLSSQHPSLPGMASSCCECTVCVGRVNIIPGQPWLLLRGAISCYVLAFAPNHRHPCLPVPPNWPFGDCLLPSCIGLCYISPSRGRKSPLLSPSGMQHGAEDGSRLNWVEVLSVECASTSSLPGILLHTHTFLTLIFEMPTKVVDRKWSI